MIGAYVAFFEKNYKWMAFLPLILILLSLIVTGAVYSETGSFVYKDVSLKGGLAITIDNTNNKIPESVTQLESNLKTQFPEGDFSLQEISEPRSVLIHVSDVEADSLENYMVSRYGEFEQGAYNVKVQSSAFGASFFTDTVIAIIIAFLFMGIVVFIYFRKLGPSLSVVFAALSDLIITVGVINLLQLRLSTSGVAALLMIIGYSVDTNILLSSKVTSKTDETFAEKLTTTMGTGLMMTLTTLSAIAVGLFFAKAPELHQIFLILLIGLLSDLIMTWIQNASILRYLEDRK